MLIKRLKYFENCLKKLLIFNSLNYSPAKHYLDCAHKLEKMSSHRIINAFLEIAAVHTVDLEGLSKTYKEKQELDEKYPF